MPPGKKGACPLFSSISCKKVSGKMNLQILSEELRKLSDVNMTGMIKNFKRQFFLITLYGLSLSLITCGGSGDVDDSDVFADAEWQLLTTRDIQGGITFDGTTGTLTLVDDSGSDLGTRILFVFDTSSGEESTAGISEESNTFTYPGDAKPGDSAYFGLALDGVKIGKFVTSATFKELPLSVVNGPSEETTSALSSLIKQTSIPVPTDGSWDFSMDVSSSYLSGSNCPSGSASFTSEGEATLNMSCDGYTVDLDIDGEHVSYHLTSSYIYRSPDYTFPVLDEEDNIVYGSNYYEMTPASTMAIGGNLHWDNSLGCTATYPYTLELLAETPATINDVCEGSWILSYPATIPCGSELIVLPSLSFMPLITGEVSTNSLPSGSPVDFTFDDGTTSFYLIRQGCTNIYGNLYVPAIIGVGFDSNGLPMIIDVGIQLMALSTTEMYGTGLLNVLSTAPSGTNCSAVPFLFTMTSLSSC